MFDELVVKLVEAIVFAPYWSEKPWFIYLSKMSSETFDMPPETDLLFSPR